MDVHPFVKVDGGKGACGAIVCVAPLVVVPVLAPIEKIKLAVVIAFNDSVFPTTAVAEISAVIKRYPVVPPTIDCAVKAGNVLTPAVPGVVNVLNVLSAASNKLSTE